MQNVLRGRTTIRYNNSQWDSNTKTNTSRQNQTIRYTCKILFTNTTTYQLRMEYMEENNTQNIQCRRTRYTQFKYHNTGYGICKLPQIEYTESTMENGKCTQLIYKIEAQEIERINIIWKLNNLMKY